MDNEMMRHINHSYQLSLYIKGDELDPDELTALLRIEATKSHAKGKKWVTSGQKEVVEKTGLWALVLRGDGDEELSTLVSRMKAELGRGRTSIDHLPGVQEAYLDVLALIDADEDGGGTCEFSLDMQSITDLYAIGLPVHFTIAVVVP